MLPLLKKTDIENLYGQTNLYRILRCSLAFKYPGLLVLNSLLDKQLNRNTFHF